ncbi:FAD-dependent oxidoreductase [Nocardioides stalactiti]|uniref:FAD-dependent oxidoreductase n=1 Tax=Nocardioides stalactiti TaxID=2755356 RepID=UPI0016004188|nr:FAD-dependent oxidoreductase [Nocardioides stalactiti]
MQIDPAMDVAAGFLGEVLYGDAWRDHDFSGQRVAVLATGRDAARVLADVAWTARTVKVFLDDPDWVLPALPGPLSGVVHAATWVPVAGPLTHRLLARAHLRLAVKDPWIRRLLTPDDRFTRHATTTSDLYYAALQDPHCKLIRWPVYAITAEGVRTAEGIEHQVDCIVVPAPERLRPLPAPARAPRPTRSREDRSA